MFTESTTQAQCFAAVTDALRLMAKGKLDNYDIYYDLIEDSNDVSHQKIIDSLKISEIIVAGYAWAAYYGQQGVFDSYDYPANHCFRIGDGGNISQEVKSKFEGRGYDIDWSLVDLIAIDSYRFDWVNDPATDHENLNDFLKPLAKTYKINSAYRIYLIPKKKISFLTLFKNMQEFLWSYSDQHGVYFYFVKKINGVLNKQFMDISKLPDDLSFLKGLAIIFGEIGATRQTSWAEISTIPDHKFF